MSICSFKPPSAQFPVSKSPCRPSGPTVHGSTLDASKHHALLHCTAIHPLQETNPTNKLTRVSTPKERNAFHFILGSPIFSPTFIPINVHQRHFPPKRSLAWRAVTPIFQGPDTVFNPSMPFPLTSKFRSKTNLGCFQDRGQPPLRSKQPRQSTQRHPRHWRSETSQDMRDMVHPS